MKRKSDEEGKEDRRNGLTANEWGSLYIAWKFLAGFEFLAGKIFHDDSKRKTCSEFTVAMLTKWFATGSVQGRGVTRSFCSN
jgi:hypothetical protein